MLFRRDNGREQAIWVDRGIDGRVDNSGLCNPCDGLLQEMDPLGEQWHDVASGLCPDCKADLLAHALAIDLFGLPRPLNGDIEGRYITNDELDEKQRPGNPLAFGYFVDERGGL